MAKKKNNTKKEANLGDVYMINTSYIDNDKKSRRRFVITKKNENNVSVQKLVGIHSKTKFDIDGIPHIIEIDRGYQGLTKRTGILNKEFRNKRDREHGAVTRLNINDNELFKEVEFTLNDNDLQKTLSAASSLKTLRNRKRKKKSK